MSTEAKLPIGEVLAKLEREFPDVTISKIRFLEAQGLVEPQRTSAGYRRFFESDIERLRWILGQQRDNFLPLKIIKDRLDSGEWRETVDADGAGTTAPSPAARPMPRAQLKLGATETRYTAAELVAAAKLEADRLGELERFGLVEGVTVDDEVLYGADALTVCSAAAAFLRHGLEPRHLKAWKVAAEREAGVVEQIILPVSRQGNAAAKAKAQDLATELVDLGDQLRHAMISRSLRSTLDLD